MTFLMHVIQDVFLYHILFFLLYRKMKQTLCIFGAGNGSPMATNVVLIVVLGAVVVIRFSQY